MQGYKFSRVTRQINIRVSAQEWQQLEDFAKQKNKSKSDVIRYAIRRLPVKK